MSSSRSFVERYMDFVRDRLGFVYWFFVPFYVAYFAFFVRYTPVYVVRFWEGSYIKVEVST